MILGRCLGFGVLSLLISVSLLTHGKSFAADSVPTLGTSWALRQSPTELRAVAFGAGKFVAVGKGKLATSPDGVIWTERTAPSTNNWSSLVYGNGKFVAIDFEDSGIAPENIMTSVDGITWSIASDGLPPGQIWYSLIHGNGLFLAGAVGTFSASQLMTSPDGVTWTQRTISSGAPGVYSLAYGNGVYVAVASPNGLSGVVPIHSSSNGIDWTPRSVPEGVSPNVDLFGVTYGGGQFVAVGSGRTILTSPDGVTWTDRSTSEAVDFTDIVHGNGVYLAFGYIDDPFESRIFRSLDGVSWVRQTTASTLPRGTSTYAHGLVVALSYFGTTTDTVMTSGTFGVQESVEFVPKSARLTASAKAALVAALAQLDASRTIKATFALDTDKPIGRNSLSSRRAQAVIKFLGKQQGYRMSRRVLVRKVKKVAPADADKGRIVFRYR